MKINTFTEFKLNESNNNREENIREFGCAMLYFKTPKEITQIHKLIDENDMHDYGIEKETHTTLLYGLHSWDILLDDVKKICDKYSFDKIILKNLSIFENPDFDVLKFEADNDNLLKVNKDLSELPHTSKFKDYKPHCTIAYLKKGMGKEYIKKIKEKLNIIKEIKVKPYKIVYSYPKESSWEL